MRRRGSIWASSQRPEVDGVDHTPRLDRGDLDEDQPNAADRARTVVHHMPVVGRPAVHGGQLVHGGHDDAVPQGHAAQAQGIEQTRHQVLTETASAGL